MSATKKSKLAVSNNDVTAVICVEKSGNVKEEAFFTILALHNIKLDDNEKGRLKKTHARAGKIKYVDAL